jgi:site-specific DNA recombinase
LDSKLTHTLHIYTRVSSSVQEEEGTSLETQKELGIKKAEDLGFSYQLWNEGGQSSFKEDLDNRPVLRDLLSKIESGEIKHVFVFNADRLSRNEITWGLIRLKLVKHDVTLHIPFGIFLLSNPIDKLLLGILAEISSYDNSTRADRTRQGKLRRIKQGYWLGGPPPYGYKLVEKKLVPDEEETKWVKYIFESYRDKKTSREIRQVLLSNGVKTRRGNNVWSLGSIEKLLTNTHYSGFYMVTDNKSGETVRVECEPILSFSLYSESQSQRQSRSKRRVKESNQKHFYLLRDFLVCDHCGCYFSGETQSDTSRSVYYCPRKERNYTSLKSTECANSRYLKIAETDQLIWETVVEILSKSVQFKEEVKTQILGESKTYTDQAVEISKLKKTLKSIELELKQTNTTLVNLETDILLNKWGADNLKQIMSNIEQHNLELKTKREEIKLKLHSLENQTKWVDWISEFGEKINNLKELNVKDQKEFLSHIIDKIVVKTVDKQTHKLNINFRLPYISDRLIWNDSSDKSKGYEIQDGSKSHELEMYSKKK